MVLIIILDFAVQSPVGHNFLTFTRYHEAHLGPDRALYRTSGFLTKQAKIYWGIWFLSLHLTFFFILLFWSLYSSSAVCVYFSLVFLCLLHSAFLPISHLLLFTFILTSSITLFSICCFHNFHSVRKTKSQVFWLLEKNLEVILEWTHSFWICNFSLELLMYI